MRGQAAFEYLMIFSIVVTLITALVMYAGTITDSNQEELRMANVVTVANNIVESANIVSTQGKPSQITLDSVYMPEGIESINITGNSVWIKVRISSGVNDIFVTSKTNLNGTISTSQGIKKIRIRAEDNYVNITEV
jgi:hypothetical protein